MTMTTRPSHQRGRAAWRRRYCARRRTAGTRATRAPNLELAGAVGRGEPAGARNGRHERGPHEEDRAREGVARRPDREGAAAQTQQRRGRDANERERHLELPPPVQAPHNLVRTVRRLGEAQDVAHCARRQLVRCGAQALADNAQ